jgi:formate dehydrogenase subunit gamma
METSRVQAFNTLQIWFHKHIIHFMVLFILSGLPILSHAFDWIAYVFGVPVSFFGQQQSYEAIVAGGVQTARVLHRVAALLFFLTAIPFSLGQLMHVREWHIWPERYSLSGAWDGVRELIRCYVFFQPPRFGKYNIGQKALAWFMILAMLLLSLSGLVLWFRDSFSPAIWSFSRFVHDAVFLLTALALIVHVYLGTHPINRESLRAMFGNGEMDLEFIKHHHPLWYEKLIKKGGQTT